MEIFNHKPKMTPKDFFFYLGAMVTLYVSAVALITLLFQYINILFPDELEFAYTVDAFSSAIRFSMATLIVVFPLYVFLTRRVNTELRKHSEKRELGIRKWLIYVTLFVAGATLAGDLIALINTFLEGELTARFALKVLTIFVVIGAVFMYYLYDLRGVWEKREKESKLVGAVVAILVVLSLAGGFFVVGSPREARLLRIDEQKVYDLQSIQGQIIFYWQGKETLPENLKALEDPIVGYVAPTDPETDEPYAYQATGPLSFELCADFNLESEEKDRNLRPVRMDPFSRNPADSNWDHEAGEHCFERTIDPELIQLRKEL